MHCMLIHHCVVERFVQIKSKRKEMQRRDKSAQDWLVWYRKKNESKLPSGR